MEISINFISVVTFVSLGMLIWACIEVGSNDATNLVNAVFGARILQRKTAVTIAGIFVILGAIFASPVMDTVRKGIFDTAFLDAEGAVCVFIASYLVNTVLLYTYSGYGLPVSTTATLVFSLAGGALGVSREMGAVQWDTLGKVVGAIFVSILFSGVIAFLVQRMFRGAIRKDSQRHDLVLLHGPWITGLTMVSLCWFMIVTGMSEIPAIAEWKDRYLGSVGTGGLLVILWALFTLITHLLLTILGRKGTKYLFHATAVIGMVCMAFAFVQNDLANCASPGLANWMIWKQGLDAGSKMSIPLWTLFSCGFLMFMGMSTKRAQRVTRAEINTASQQSKVKLYAPEWCVRLARLTMRSEKSKEEEDSLPDVAPASGRSEDGKKLHYDPLRASVILAVSACVIAFASGLGLPVSTTYVCFAAVIATGWGDRVFTRGRSDLKMGRAIWVVTSWLMGAAIAALASAFIAFTIYHLQYFGLALAFALNLSLRLVFKRRSDSHEDTYHKKFKMGKSRKKNAPIDKRQARLSL